ncbi:fimbrial protein [Silvimonas sp. JCM 19000]
MFIQRLLVCSALGLPTAAFAVSNNTLQFLGEITSQTCEVTVNGNKNLPVVLLPTVQASKMASANAAAGRTEFTLEVKGCTSASASTSTVVKTIFIATTPDAGGRMTNTGSAGNVSLRIVDPQDSYKEVPLTGGGETGLTLAAGAADGVRKYAVEYVADAQVTAGTVTGAVQYAISYQ